jgi:hypothetical protein
VLFDSFFYWTLLAEIRCHIWLIWCVNSLAHTDLVDRHEISFVRTKVRLNLLSLFGRHGAHHCSVRRSSHERMFDLSTQTWQDDGT